MARKLELAVNSIVSGSSTSDAIDSLLEQEGKKHLTNEMMTKMVPMFVASDDPEEDHKCGNCFMRMEKDGDEAECTVVKGNVSLSKGVCLYWSKGDPKGKKHPARMDKENAVYGEMPEGEKVNCASCQYYTMDKKYCSLWDGLANPGECCSAHDSPRYQ
jgi:hypothetical protein